MYINLLLIYNDHGMAMVIWSESDCNNQFNIELLFQLRELVIQYLILLDQSNINI